MKKQIVKKKPVKRQKIQHEIQTEYLSKVYGAYYLSLVPAAVKTLRALKKKYKFDAIAFRGSSGAALAFPLSYFLKVPLIHVRKGKSHYGGGPIEGTISSQRYVIVDDFVDSGRTVKTIVREIKKEMDAKPVAICLYAGGNYSASAEFDGIPLVSIKVPK